MGFIREGLYAKKVHTCKWCFSQKIIKCSKLAGFFLHALQILCVEH